VTEKDDRSKIRDAVERHRARRATGAGGRGQGAGGRGRGWGVRVLEGGTWKGNARGI
jgi:hypothetical protein